MKSLWQTAILVASFLAMPFLNAIAQTSAIGPTQSGTTFHPIPLQDYAIIDISGTTFANENIAEDQIDESNRVGFTDSKYLYSGSTETTYTWQNGILSVGTTFTPTSQSQAVEGGTDTTTTTGSIVKGDGSLYGVQSSVFDSNTDPSEDTSTSQLFSSGSTGSNTFTTLPSPYQNVNMSPSDATENGVIYGNATSDIVYVNTSGTVTEGHNFPFVLKSGQFTAFDTGTYGGPQHPPFSGVTVVSDHSFYPYIVNKNGWAAGRDGTTEDAYVWTGPDDNFTPLAPMSLPEFINDPGQVLGVNGTTCYLWTSPTTTSSCSLITPGSVQDISKFIPQQYQNEISNISPLLAISGTNAAGSIKILFNAIYQYDSSGNQQDGTFILTLQAGATPSTLQQINTPVQDYNLDLFDSSVYEINSNGFISCTAELDLSDDPDPPDHALVLLPVELTNKADPTKRNGADGTDKQIDLMSSSTGTDLNAVAWIAASDTTQAQVVTGVYPPRMPELVASSGSIPGLTYCWKLKVIFHDRHGNPHRDFDTGDPNDTNSSSSVAPQDTVTIPAASSADSNVVNGWKEITDGSPWNIYQSNDWINAVLQGFFGGDAELSLKILDSSGNTICPEQDYYFRIEGENPDPTVCQNYINAVYNGPTPNWQNVASTGTTTPPTVPGYWFAYAIAKEETDGDGGRTWYNNFLDNGGQYHAVPGKEGKPDWNNDGSTANPTSGSGGYGLFQLTFQPGDTNYIMPRDWIWNWQSNVQQFLPIAQQKLGYTQGYLNYIKANNASYFDPSSLTTTADTTTFNFWESSVITLNNGASVIVGPRGHRRAGAWTFNSGPPASWHYKANSQQYLYKVAYHGVENHP